MRCVLGWLVVALACGGCRQLFGIDDTEVAGDDALDAPVDGKPGPPDAASIDAQPNTPDAIAPDASACATLYPLAFGAHRYKLGNQQLNWSSAQGSCALDGGYLAVPDDGLENDFFATLNDGTLWLGITDEGHEGTYVSVLGDPITYTNWGNGEPNGGTVENCVQIMTSASGGDGKWEDADCPNNRRAICECAP